MVQSEIGVQPVEVNREISFPGSVSFDSNSLQLQGMYADQLSAYRARKVWAQTLETCFLLDKGYDFTLLVNQESESDRYTLQCEFLSACARYAFWRLTNHQAPEAQYLIETAHIPHSESRFHDFISAPDMRSMFDDSLDLPAFDLSRIRRQPSLLNRVKSILAELLKK